MQKLYCVHVYEQPHEYENVKAKNPADAEQKIIAREWAGNYETISSVEVMLQCQKCGYDNEPRNKKCDECGKKI